MICVYCGSDRVVRSHRQGLGERLLSVLVVFPYRCRQCEKRIYARSYRKLADVTKTWERVRTQLFVFAFGLLCCLVLVYFLIQERVPASE